jgi:hypothetical protein
VGSSNPGIDLLTLQSRDMIACLKCSLLQQANQPPDLMLGRLVGQAPQIGKEVTHPTMGSSSGIRP